MIARAARDAGMPAAISFTVETDGRLRAARPCGDAIERGRRRDRRRPAYYMINCAHPTHFERVARADAPWPRADPRPARQRLDA